MLWGHAYRDASYLRSSLWIVPFVAIVLALMLAPLLPALDGERSRLDTMPEKRYPIPDDLALARIADSKGSASRRPPAGRT